MTKCRRPISVVIPAAGAGRRMRSYGPKALVDLGGATLLESQVRVIRSAFSDPEVVVVVGHEAERVARRLPRGVRAVENPEHGETNVTRSLGLGLAAATRDAVLVVYGDVVFNRAALRGVSRFPSVVVDRSGQIAADSVGVCVADGRATRFDYGLPAKWAQIAFLEGPELEAFRRYASDERRRKHFGFEALNAVVDAGGRLRAVEPRGMRLAEVDRSADITRAREVRCGS